MGKFAVKQVKTGIMFNLKANNGQVIATSEVYNSDAACRKGIDSVRRNAPIAPIENQTVEGYAKEKLPKFEVYLDKAGEYRFRLKATNGQIIAVGESYKQLSSCLNGIESVKKERSRRRDRHGGVSPKRTHLPGTTAIGCAGLCCLYVINIIYYYV